MLNGADEAADFRPVERRWNHAGASGGIYGRTGKLEKKGGAAVRGMLKPKGSTQEDFKAVLEGKLYVGKKIKKIVFSREDSTGPVRKDKKTGTVTGLYPFVFTVDFGKYTESFRYGQLFEEGNEVVKL